MQFSFRGLTLFQPTPCSLTFLHSFPNPTGPSSPSIDQMLAVASDQLAEQLDAAKGAGVSDHSIFRAHAAKYEVRRSEKQERAEGGK